MEAFVEQVKNIDVASWILIGSMLLIILLLIIVIAVSLRIMSKYTMEVTRSRIARLVGRIEIIDGWCCAVVENTGQVSATNVKVKLTGSIVKYYYNYVNTCHVTDSLKAIFGSKFTLVAGDRKNVKLFPVGKINTCQSIVETRKELIGGDPIVLGKDLNLEGKTEHTDEIEIEELVDSEDAEVLKAIAKEQQKVAELRAKQDEIYNKELHKLNMKKQAAIVKYNKKKGEETHTSTIPQPSLEGVRRHADATFNIEYESMGYLMKKNKFTFKNLDLSDQPQELRTKEDILIVQNSLLDQVVFLQEQIRTLIGEPVNKD